MPRSGCRRRPSTRESRSADAKPASTSAAIPSSAIRTLAERVLARVAAEPDDARCNTFAGAMRLIDYLPTRIVELTVHSLDLTDAIGTPATVRSTPVALTMDLMLVSVDPLVLMRALGGRRSLPDGFSVFG